MKRMTFFAALSLMSILAFENPEAHACPPNTRCFQKIEGPAESPHGAPIFPGSPGADKANEKLERSCTCSGLSQNAKMSCSKRLTKITYGGSAIQRHAYNYIAWKNAIAAKVGSDVSQATIAPELTQLQKGFEMTKGHLENYVVGLKRLAAERTKEIDTVLIAIDADREDKSKQSPETKQSLTQEWECFRNMKFSLKAYREDILKMCAVGPCISSAQ